MTDEQIIRVLAEFNGLYTLLEKMHAPDYLHSLDAQGPILDKLNRLNQESPGCRAVTLVAKNLKRLQSDYLFGVLPPKVLARALAEAIVEAGLVTL